MFFQKHIGGQLAALVDGQLGPKDAARATEHLAGCARCRHAHDRVQFSAGVLSQLALVEAPASIWASIEWEIAQGDQGDRRIAQGDRRIAQGDRGDQGVVQGGVLASLAHGWAWNRTLAVAAVLALATTAVVLWQVNRQPATWDVVRLDAPGGAQRMAIGEWIETDATSRAAIKIGEIGTVDIAPNTRMQLLVAQSNEHRLNLSRGLISAQILAPPRLFFVETPASTVVDLGCAYTMQVDETGAGILRVTSGWASLEWDERESIVPAGASCPTRPEVGPGTPSFDDASERLRQALLSFDFDAGGRSALDTVLSDARDRDTLTLWHLLSRVDEADRSRVFDRMVELGAPLPAGVTRDQVLALDRETLKRWREELAWTW